MARPPYSTVFIVAETGVTDIDFVVADGDTAVLHNMSFHNLVRQPLPVSSRAFDVYIDGAPHGVWGMDGDGMLITTYSWAGREVFNTTLHLHCDVPTYGFRASGYLLTPT
jgi:hypothetical protein